MTLCRFENRVADPLAETASSHFVKQLDYLTLLHQACQTFSIVCVALGVGREVPVRLLLSAGHWAPPFQCRPLFGPTVFPKTTFRSSAKGHSQTKSDRWGARTRRGGQRGRPSVRRSLCIGYFGVGLRRPMHAHMPVPQGRSRVRPPASHRGLLPQREPIQSGRCDGQL